MSRLPEHLGERFDLLRTLMLCVGFITILSAGVGLLLYSRQQVGLLGAVGVLLLGPPIGLALAGLVMLASGAASRGLVRVLTGAGDIRRAPGHSLEQSLAARGKYAEAAEAYRRHIAAWPEDLDARLALAALLRDHLGDPVAAEGILLEVRNLRPSPRQEFAVGNALIDLYHASGREGRELAELARFAERFGDTEAGVRARAALRRIKTANG